MSLQGKTNNVYIEDSVKYDNTENVSLNINIENLESKLHVLGLDIKYDTSKLEFVSAKQNKNINSTMKLAENFPEENRVAIGMMSVEGFKQTGTYYTVTFKVLNDNEDIPVQLSIREATDDEGNNVLLNSSGRYN